MSEYKAGDAVEHKAEKKTGKVFGTEGGRVGVEWKGWENVASSWVEPSEIQKPSK